MSKESAKQNNGLKQCKHGTSAEIEQERTRRKVGSYESEFEEKSRPGRLRPE